MKVKNFLATMCCPLVLEHIKLILSKTGERTCNYDFKK